MTRERRSSSTRRKSFPKFARARKAETTIVPFLPVVVVAINSSFQLSELYSLAGEQSTRLKRSNPEAELNPRYPLRYVRFRGGSFIRLTTVFSTPGSEFTCKNRAEFCRRRDSGAALRAFLGVFFRGNDGGERGI